MTWNKYREPVQAWKDMLRKAKIHLKLNLERDMKGNRKGFLKYIASKRKTRQKVGLLLNGAGDLLIRTQKRPFQCLFHLSLYQ